jgi:general secretion pathway protein N
MVRKTLRLILLCGTLAWSGWTPALCATQSSTLDILPDDVAGSARETIETGRIRPLGGKIRPEGGTAPTGNPLWSIPLSALSVTRDRPVFSASRRPPPRAVAAARVVPIAPPPPPPAAPEHPSLALIGAVVGENDAIAVFLDTANRGMVRLRRGEDHAGWTLSSVMPREVVLKKGEQTETLALQRQDGVPGVSGAPGVPGVPGVAPNLVPGLVPGVGRTVPGVTTLPPPAPAGANTSFAPFVPRSTPKNGESDGL